MAETSALSIHEAAEAAILALVSDPKSSATFAGRSYTVQDIETLTKVSELYRQKAIKRGELYAPNEERSLTYSIDTLNPAWWL